MASHKRQLADEMRNFREIAAYLMPSAGETPRIDGIDIAGLSLPLRGAIGGDHLIYIDFNRRYNLERRIARARRKDRHDAADTLEQLQSRAGILLADVSGHRMTDALIGAMLHQAFLVGVQYELDRYGEITTRIFEHLNTRFYRTTAVHKYFTMLYGEINTEGRFRFISAGHQPPMVYSREFGKLMQISPERLIAFPPVGMLPPSDDPDEPVTSVFQAKKQYEVNQIELLSPGDILLLLTDGLAEHDEGRLLPDIEALLREGDGDSATEICDKVLASIVGRNPQTDDISFVVIRRAT